MVNDFPFFYRYTSDTGAYYGTRSTAGVEWYQKAGDATFLVMQQEIYELVKSGHAHLLFEDEDCFPSLFFNFNTLDAEAAYLKTYGKHLHEMDIRSK